MGNKRVAAFAGFFVALAVIYLLHAPQRIEQRNVNPAAKVTDLKRGSGLSHSPGVNVFNFVGMGDIAVLFDAHSPDGGSLYTILNRGNQTGLASFHFIANHVVWAKFSPNGRWLALERTGGGATGPQRTLWLASANGEQQQQIAAGVKIPAGAWMPNGNTFLYGVHHLYSLSPLGAPRYLPLRFSGKPTIRSIEFSPDGRTAALLISENTPGTKGSYDEIALWRRAARSVRPLVVVAPPNGLALGPFSADGRSLFYWPSPARAPGAAGVARSLLSVVTLRGQGSSVGITPIEQRAIQPFGRNSALVLVAGNAASAGQSLRLAVLRNGVMSMLPGNENTVELWPAINPQAAQIAFATNANAGSGTGASYGTGDTKGQLQLATYDLGSTHMSVIGAAGKGVSMPAYDATGRRILYIQNGNLMWIAADGRGAPYFVAGPNLRQGNLAAMPNGQQSTAIADYLPAPDRGRPSHGHTPRFP